MKSAPVLSCISFSWIHSFRGPFHSWSTSPFCVLHSFFSSYRTKKKLPWKTQEVRVSAWAHTQWMRKCSQTPKHCSGSCRAHSNWTCWDWSCNLSFPAGTRMAFAVTFFLKFLFTMPLWGSRSKPSSWGLSWHWSDHLGLFCSYFIPFVTWTFWDMFHVAMTWTSPVFFISLQIKGPLLQSANLYFIALILFKSSHYHKLSRVTMAKISLYLITLYLIC